MVTAEVGEHAHLARPTAPETQTQSHTGQLDGSMATTARAAELHRLNEATIISRHIDLLFADPMTERRNAYGMRISSPQRGRHPTYRAGLAVRARHPDGAELTRPGRRGRITIHDKKDVPWGLCLFAERRERIDTIADAAALRHAAR